MSASKPPIKNFEALVSIDNNDLISYRWNCTRPAYGAVGSFRAYFSREVLTNAKVNLYEIGQKAKGQVPVNFKINDLDTGASYNIFGGEMDTVVVEYDEDIVIVEGRDWAGLLVDQKGMVASQFVYGGKGQVPLTGGPTPCNDAGKTAPTGADSLVDGDLSSYTSINLIDKSPSALAYYIAIKNGFKPDIWTTAEPVTAGTLMGGTGTSPTTPRTLWETLQYLARLLGWSCYVTPDRTLYFGPFNITETQALSWNVFMPPPDEIPARALRIDYNPRRNRSFLVMVSSYTDGDAVGSVGMIGYVDAATLDQIKQTYPKINVQNSKFIVGTAGAPSPYAMSALFSDLGKPVYFYSAPLLNQNQASIKALEYALEIAKRELIMHATVDGNPYLDPMVSLTLTGDIGDFQATQYYANGIEHSFSMEEGWYTHISAWTLPPTTSSQFLQASGIRGVASAPLPATRYTGP